MRVISGLAKGRVLESLEGEATRPTTDRVKESIFNIIQFDIEGRRVLDLFGGSGQMSIEAVSRGADFALVVENSKQAATVIRNNIKKCGFSDKMRLYIGDFSEVLTKDEKYDVIFLDPPYNSAYLAKAISMIHSIDILSNGGIIVCETDKNAEIPDLPYPYHKRREYIYGRTKITVIRKTEGDSESE